MSAGASLLWEQEWDRECHREVPAAVLALCPGVRESQAVLRPAGQVQEAVLQVPQAARVQAAAVQRPSREWVREQVQEPRRQAEEADRQEP